MGASNCSANHARRAPEHALTPLHNDFLLPHLLWTDEHAAALEG
jgi:hypothetical protein